jgi:hypothetical protein
MRKRRRRAPARYRDDYYEDDYYSRRRGRRRSPNIIQRFFIKLLWTLTVIVTFVLLLLIAFNFVLFIKILVYVLFVIAGLGILWVFYLAIRLITSISLRISEARKASALAKQEQVRVQQEQERIKLAQSKRARDEYAFYQKRQPTDRDLDRYSSSPRRTRVLREEEAPGGDQVPSSRMSPYQTRVLAQQAQIQQVSEQQVETPPPAIPHIIQVLGNLVQVGQTDLLHGFLVNKKNGTIEAVRGELPGTAIIAGKGRSGKTRRIILMVFQALLVFHALGKGYKITVCDPHAEKPDGLLKVLAPFLPWLHTARTNSEIVAVAREHLEELESRLSPGGSRNGEGLMPRLLIIDEFPKLMKSSLSKTEKRIIADAVRKSAVEYQGVFGYVWIIGQEWTEDAIFDTALRKDAQAIFCHQLSAEYASFLFPLETKTQRLVQQIERRECVFKDADNHVLRIMTTTVTDEEIPELVNYLTRYVPRPAPRQTRAPSSQQPQPRQKNHLEQQAFQAHASSRQRSEVSIQQEGSVRRTRILRENPPQANGSPDDTVLVPEPEEAIPQEVLTSAAGETATVPATEDQRTPQGTFVTAEQFALLAKIQRKKR